MSTHKKNTTPEAARKIADHARQRLPCEDCGAEPGQPCAKSGNGNAVCRGRYIAAAIITRQQEKAARRTPNKPQRPPRCSPPSPT